MTQNDHSTLMAVAHAAADAAAEQTLRYFRSRGLQADNKMADGFDPVTAADREAERAIRRVLKTLRPDDAILGEEEGETPGSTGITWVIDPVDGTRAFIAGAPTWGTLIAAVTDSGPILGLIDQPHTRERFVGEPKGATLSGQAIRVNPRGSLDMAVLASTFPEVGTDQERRAFERVSARARLTRFGLDCYAYALLAAGHIDLVIEAGLNAYDIAAPIAVIEAAGGVVTTWDGQPAHHGGQILAAASQDLHAAALEVLNG
ncbi:MAG: histidinol-phosphatase [Shimia sp.]